MDIDKPQLLRIVPPPPLEPGQPSPVEGTRFFVGNAELHGVTHVVLYADVNGMWKASLDMLVDCPTQLHAQLEAIQASKKGD